MSGRLGVIHDPDVVFTDLGLAVLAGYLAWRLWTRGDGRTLPRAGALLLGALASAALWGAIFHAFFPAGTATRPGSLVWIPVGLSIVIAAATMVELGLRILSPQLALPVRRWVVMTYAAIFASVVVLVDESFTSIVYFYAPALLLLLLAAGTLALRGRNTGWGLIAGGLMMSVLAAALQQLRVALHPVYFDHNALYHVVQGIGIVVLYLGWTRAPEAVVVARSR